MPNAERRLVQDSLLVSASWFPDKVAIVDEQSECTYRELRDDSLRFARALQDAGLVRGDRVALYLDNTVQCAVAIFGVLSAGGVFTVVNPQTKAEKLTYILNDSEAAFLVTEAHSVLIATTAVAGAPSVRGVYVTSGTEFPHGFTELSQTLAASEPEPRAPSTIPLDLAGLVYTSGTTGEPKGVMLNHQALVFAAGSIAEYLRLDPDDRILSVLPLAFTYGLNQLLLAMRLGATLLLERSFAFPTKTLRRLSEEKATVFPAVPTMFVTILGLTNGTPYPSVRRITNAAAGLPPSLHEGIRRAFPNGELFRMYGLTECQRVSYLEPHLVDTKPTSVGRAMPGTEAVVLNDRGEPIAPGEVGVLHVRGPHVMMGYWRAPELTAHKLREGSYPGDRVLCTHDNFTVDADGDLYFVDRSDDVIKTRGGKVSSVEVENTLHGIPGVRHAAVIGVPDELLGESVRAYVVAEEGVRLDEQELIRVCRAQLENIMVPREIVFLDDLPRTESGKIRKKSLSRDPLEEPPATRLSA